MNYSSSELTRPLTELRDDLLLEKVKWVVSILEWVRRRTRPKRNLGNY